MITSAATVNQSTEKEFTMEDAIEMKIEVLKDFCILNRRTGRQEQTIRKILSTCKSEYELDRKLYSVLHEGTPIDEFIRKNWSVLH